MTPTRMRLPRRSLLFVLLVNSFLPGSFPGLRLITQVFSQEGSPDSELAQQQSVVDRYLTVLEKNPRRGTALDRIYGFHIENGTLEVLIKRYQERVAQNPKDGNSWTILGLIESQRGRDAAAVKAFKQAQLAQTPDAMSAYYLGQSLVLIGQPDEAVNAFEKALTLQPAEADLLEIFQALGRVHQRAQRTREALEVWARLEKLFPKDLNVQEQIATSLAEEGQEALALPRYEQLIKLSRDDYRKSMYRIAAAGLKIKLNRSADAIADLDKLLTELNPTSWLYRDVRRQIEDVFLRTDDQDGLAKYYQGTIAKNPEDVDAMARLARILAKQGRVPEAQVWLDKALKLAPTRKELRRAFIDQLVDDQRISEAIAQYALLNQADPNNPDVWREWGKLVLRDTTLPKPERAKQTAQIWQRILTLRPNDPLTVTQVADLCRQSEMTERALELYQQAVALAPGQPQYLEYLGEYYHQLKRGSEALTTWRKITEGPQRTSANLARLAEVLASFGYLKEAIPEIQAACQLDPKDFGLQLKAADLLVKAEQYPGAVDALAKAEQLAQSPEETEQVLKSQLDVFQLQNTLESQTAKLIAAGSQTPPTAKQWYVRARYHEAQRQFAEATAAIKAALQLEPRSIVMLSTAARIYEQAGDLQVATDLNRQLSTIDRRGQSEYLKRVVQLETQLGRPDEALKAGRELVAAAPGNVESQGFYANLCFQLDKVEEGLQTLRRAVRLNPNDPKMAHSLATALANQYRTDEAIELYWQAYDKSRDLDDKLSQIQKLTELYLQTNHLNNLLERIERIRRDADDKRETTIVLAQAHSTAGNSGLARQELESLLSDGSRDPQLLLQLSNLAESERDLASAIKFQQQLVNLAPGHENEYRLASLLTQSGAEQEGVSITTRLAEKETDPAKFLATIDALIKSEKNEIALELIKSRLREQPRNWELLYREGALLALRDPAAASRRFKAILELPDTEDEFGIALKKQLEKEAQSGSAVLRDQLARSNSLEEQGLIRDAVGLSLLPNETLPYTGEFWVPSRKAHARQAALAWLLRFANNSGNTQDFLAPYTSRARDQKATPRTLWDALYLEAVSLALDESTSLVASSEFRLLIQRLAVAGEWEAQNLFFQLLQNRWLVLGFQSHWYLDELSWNDTLPPLSQIELDQTLAVFRAAGTRQKNDNARIQYQRFTRQVIAELMGAEMIEEARKICDEAIAGANTRDELFDAISLATIQVDVPRTLELFDKWCLAIHGGTGHSNGKDPGRPIAKLIGVCGAAQRTTDCLQLLDRYLDYVQTVPIPKPHNTTSKPAAFSPYGGSNVIFYWYGKSMMVEGTNVYAGDYYNQSSLSVLRTTYEVFQRHDLLPDLRDHIESRIANAKTDKKVYGYLAKAFLSEWNSEPDEVLTELQIASAASTSDWKLKLHIADLLVESQLYDDALAWLETIAAHDQEVLQHREKLAIDLAIRVGDHERAREAAERLFGLRLEPSAQLALANQMEVIGMDDRAQVVLSRLQRQPGNQLSSLAALMNSRLGQGQTEIAAQIAQQILRRSAPPFVPSATRSNRLSYLHFSQISSNDSARAAALRVLMSTGKLDEMIAANEARLKQSPKSAQLIATLSEYYEAVDDPEKSRQLALRLLESKPDDAELRVRYAIQLNEAEAFTQACDQYKLVVKRRPGILLDIYPEIMSTFNSAGRNAEFASLFNGFSIQELGTRSDLIEFICETIQNPEQRPLALAQLKRVWLAFPEARMEILSRLNQNDQNWQIPELYEYGSSAFLPDASHIRNDPWSGINGPHPVGTRNRGRRFLSPLLDLGMKVNQLPQLRAAIATQSAAIPSWKAGPVIMALIDIRLGNTEAASALLERLVNEADADKTPFEVFWLIGQDLEAQRGQSQLAITVYEKAYEIDAITNHAPTFSEGIGPKLLERYVATGQKESGRKLLMAAEQHPVPAAAHPLFANRQRSHRLLEIATQYETIHYPGDALRVYRQLLTESQASDSNDNWSARTDHDFITQIRAKFNAVIKGCAEAPDANVADLLFTTDPDWRGVAFDLMIDARIEDGRIERIDCQFENLLALQQSTPEGLAVLQTSLENIGKKFPGDISVAIVSSLVALKSNDHKNAASSVSHLRKLIETSPQVPAAEGQQAKVRQRELALTQIGMWIVARQCLDHESLRSDGEFLAARALDAAKQQATPNYSIAMLHEWFQIDFQHNRVQSAEEHLSDCLAVITKFNTRNIRIQQPSNGGSSATSALAGSKAAPVNAPTVTSVPSLPRTRMDINRVRPMTRSQFQVAMLIADQAAEYQFYSLVVRAMRESLAGGMPVADPGGQSRAMFGVPPPSGGNRRQINGNPGEFEANLTSRLLNLSDLWRARAFPPRDMFDLQFDLIFPRSRPKEIVLFEKSDSGCKDPQSLGRELVYWAGVNKAFDQVEQEIRKRQSTPSAMLKGNVLLTQLAIAKQDDTVAAESLKTLLTLVNERPRTAVAVTAAHAAGLAMSRPQLAEYAAAVLEAGLTQSKQDSSQVESAAGLLAPYFLKQGKRTELRRVFEAQLAARKEASTGKGAVPGRNGAEYVLYQQQVELAQIVSVIAASQDLPLMLEYLGRFLDTPVAGLYGERTPTMLLVWQLAWQVNSLPPEERYAPLKDWILPKPTRKSLRYLGAFLRGQQVPMAFFPPDTVPACPPPEPGLTSTFSMLVDAAKSAGKLDDLQTEVDKALAENIPMAKELSILVAIARGDRSATARVQEQVDAVEARTKVPGSKIPNGVTPYDAHLLELQISEAAQASDLVYHQGQRLIKAVMAEARKVPPAERLPQIGRIFGEGGMRGLTPAERDEFRLPNLRLWHPANPPKMAINYHPLIWWTAQDGYLTHLCGNGSDPLFFRYPLSGTFEFSFDLYVGPARDGMWGYGGLVMSPQISANDIRITNIARRDTVFRPGVPLAANDWNRYSVRVTPQTASFYCNGLLIYDEPVLSGTCPWLTLNAQSTWQSTFRNLQMTGTPIIPRQVELSKDDRLDGWIETDGDVVPLRLSVRESQIRNDKPAGKPDRRADWKSEAGVIYSRRVPSTSKFRPAHLLYLRPMQAGETVKYEFLYEPGKTHIHPTFGNLALLLEPDDVRLHWINSNLENAKLAPDNSAEEPQSRRGPKKLPLKPGEWNRVEISFTAEQGRLTLNDELIFERPMEAANTRQLGFFHYRDQTAAQIRNVVLAGNWPQSLSAEELANPLVPQNPNESGALKLARNLATREEELVQNAYHVVMKGRQLSATERFDLLRDWVLPSASHRTIRLQSGFTPFDISGPVTVSPDTNIKLIRQHSGGELVAPAIDLFRTAVELKRLDELEQAVRDAAAIVPAESTQLPSLRVLLAIAKQDDAAATKELKGLINTWKTLAATTAADNRHDQLTVLEAALDRPALHADILDVTDFLLHANRPSEEWDYRLRAVRAKAASFQSRSAASQNPAQTTFSVTQWASVSHPTAELRGKGFPAAVWQLERGRAGLSTGNGNDALYFQSPLTGNFELRFRRSTVLRQEIFPTYSNLGIGLQSDGQSIWKFLQGRGRGDLQPLKMENFGPTVDYRLVIQDGEYHAYVNDLRVFTTRLPANPDPWLTLQAGQLPYRASAEDVQILGSPVIPSELKLSAAPDLTSWRSTYYGESINATNAVWSKQQDEIVGAPNGIPPGSRRQSVLQYHRPMLEDGEMQYDFYYEPGKTEIHPAVDRATFILKPTGIDLHYLTDAAYDRTGLTPDNSTPLASAAKSLPLKENGWNSLKMSLKGDDVTLVLNNEVVGSHTLSPVNQRIFGLFRQHSTLRSRIKNIVYRGDWPKQLPTVQQQELAKPD